MPPPRIAVWLHTCFRRAGSRELALTRESLAASDVGVYATVEQKPGQNPQQVFLDGWRRVAKAAAGCSHVLRLEDDVLVNRHLRHNLERWAALDEPNFGAGWLYCHEGVRDDLRNDGGGRAWARGPLSGDLFRLVPRLHGAQGVLLPARNLDRIIARAEMLTAELLDAPCGPDDPALINFDISLSSAVWATGTRVYLHEPALVGDVPDVESASGNVRPGGSSRFSPDFRR